MFKVRRTWGMGFELPIRVLLDSRRGVVIVNDEALVRPIVVDGAHRVRPSGIRSARRLCPWSSPARRIGSSKPVPRVHVR